MSQEQALGPSRREESPRSQELEDLERRNQERREEQAKREEVQSAIEAARAEAEVRELALQQEIEGLLSSDPREFVIRFLQTEGQ